MVSKGSRVGIIPVLFFGPHLLLFLVFFLLPAFSGILVAFTRWNLFSSPVWIGLDNFREIFFNTESTFYMQFWNGMSNTFRFVIMTVPPSLILPLLLAAFLRSRPPGFSFFNAVFYVPTLFSISTVMLTWINMFHRRLGPINVGLNLDINWFGTQPYTWIALVVITVWWVIGGNFIIYSASMADIPVELYEAADMDGANGIVKFFAITLPSMKHPILFTTVTSTIAQFNLYGQPLMFSRGGPGQSTYSMMMYIRELAWGSGASIAGIAAAMAVTLGFFIMLVSFAQLWLMWGPRTKEIGV